MIVDDKLMKFVVFKRRTEKEVRQKCQRLAYTKDYTDEIIEYLIENKYLDDRLYVEKYIRNVMVLKKASIFEMKMDLLKRGVLEDYIDEYISKHEDELQEFEKTSAIKLVQKRSQTTEIEKIKKYLMNKGYSYSNISTAIDNLEELQDN